MMLEKNIERKLVEEVKKAGGLALKFTSPGTVGVPDRLVLLPNGKMCFVEVKQKGKKPRPTQVVMIKTLEKLGFKVYVLDDVKEIPKIIKGLESG